MQHAGFSLIAAFALPESDWTNGYMLPRKVADKALLQKYPSDKLVAEYLDANKREDELYSRYKQHYGYVFYIAKKL